MLPTQVAEPNKTTANTYNSKGMLTGTSWTATTDATGAAKFTAVKTGSTYATGWSYSASNLATTMIEKVNAAETGRYHLSDDAFVFFLPGLMQLALLNREDDQAALLGDSLVNTLLRMARGEMNDRLKPVVGAYSNRQLSAVAKFLAAVAKLDPYPIPEKDPALSALRLFWGQFLSDHAGSRNCQE